MVRGRLGLLARVPVLLSLVAWGTSRCEAAAVQWSGNGHWYEAVYVGDHGINWTAAQNAAATKGGYLASITSAAENDFVFSLVEEDKYWGDGATRGPWLGGYQTDATKLADGWDWTGGEPWAYTNWAGGEPNDSPILSDRLQFMGYLGWRVGSWNDVCDDLTSAGGIDNPYGYVIESIPEPATLILLTMGAVALLAYVWQKRGQAARAA